MDIEKRMARALNAIYPTLYYAERMATYFQDNYFPLDSEEFQKDGKAKADFVYNYEQMQAQLFCYR